MAGQVATLAVNEGDIVEADATLLTLGTDVLEDDVAKAEAAVARAEAELLELTSGPQLGAVTAAEAQLEAADAALAQAVAQQHQLARPAREASVATAQAQLAAAEADAMSARIEWDLLHMRKNDDRKSVKEWEETAALLQLQAADQSSAAAKADVAHTERRFWSEVLAARAVVSTTLAQRDIAESRLALLHAGAAAEEIAIGEAALAQAEATSRAARVMLDQATLHAPFGGSVTSLHVSLGETVLPGQAVLTLADLSDLRVETTDLSERDVARVAVGQPAIVYVEALNTHTGGHVIDIAPRSETLGGDVVYAVALALDDQLPCLRWGMSVEVEIELDPPP
jgi:multidrug resistance efflux pump